MTIAIHNGDSRNLRCPYQAKVIKMLDTVSSNMVLTGRI
jgi:hypothetical protein